ncbi:RHS repeat-associated protein [Haloactinospora alba]|uniref:RHS repeat-associated protein n=1 Tax=Haloactinospora alba TaxID=405555 RepID=A0A543NEI9_9ACTN|nr:RHS repeat-associated core domain-containing protein [Haloactinospora alba]TQN30261.1 RHS repeat-associated protein [Haloactinospora alba]
MAYDYTPYGDAEADTAGDGDQAAGANPFTYIGSYEFDNGDKAMGHRYMSHFTDRFTQQDPSRQEDNLYTYAECDPINKSDPNGLLTSCQWSAIGFGVTTVIGIAGIAATLGTAGAAAGPSAATLGWSLGLYKAGQGYAMFDVVRNCY